MKKTTLNIVLAMMFTFISIAITGCNPTITQNIIFEIEADEHTSPELIQATLDVIKKRLTQLDLKYSAEHIMPIEGKNNTFEIPLPNVNSLEQIEQLITEKGTLEIQETFPRRNLHNIVPLDSLAAYGIQGYDQLSYGAIGISYPSDTAQITKNFKKWESVNNIRFVWGKSYLETSIIELWALPKAEARISNKSIKEAKASQGNYGDWMIDICMNEANVLTWTQLTGDNIGSQLAILIDSKVYSAPTVNDKIEGGRVCISGNFSKEEAGLFAAILDGGKTPLKVSIVD